jgi:hypothetical protein
MCVGELDPVGPGFLLLDPDPILCKMVITKQKIRVSVNIFTALTFHIDLEACVHGVQSVVEASIFCLNAPKVVMTLQKNKKILLTGNKSSNVTNFRVGWVTSSPKETKKRV